MNVSALLAGSHLADTGKVEESLPIFKSVFASNPGWVLLLQRF
jgi:hypothetical protein